MEDQALRIKTKNGLIWNAIDKFAVQGTNFFIGIFLARLLMPADYGLIAMIGVLLIVSQILIDGGFSNALIQKQNPSEADYATVFYFNLTVAIAFYLILFFSAPFVAAFYNTPQLISIARILSLSIIINALTLVQQTRLIIELDFKTQAKISLFAVLISGLLGVAAAYHSFGVWSLVIQTLSALLIRAVLLFYYNKWMPGFVFNVDSFKSLFRFSSNLLIATLIGNVIANIYEILIGKYYQAKELGYYTNAKQYPDLLAGTIGNVLLGVTYPVLAGLKDDKPRLLMVYGRLMRITVFFVMPILTLFALLTEPFIRLLLTEKWMPVVPLIQWLCFARLITPISILNSSVINAIGRSDLYLKMDLFKIPISISVLILTLPLSLNAIVMGNLGVTIIAFFINAYYPGKFFGYGAIKQIKEMLPVILATLVMAIAVLVVSRFIAGDIWKLIFGSITGVVSFLLAARILKIGEIKDIHELIQTLLASKFNIFSKQVFPEE